MRRKTFDTILSFGGVVLTIVLIVAGALLLWGSNFANSNVKSQLAQQQITFPTATALAHPNGGEITASMQKYLGQYAGKPLTTGPEAKAYADHFIAVHLNEIGAGKTYAQLSEAALAQPKNTALANQVATVFKGTTLRAMLLNAYGWWKVSQIMYIGSLIAFGLGGLALIGSVIALATGRKPKATAEALPQTGGQVQPTAA